MIELSLTSLTGSFKKHPAFPARPTIADELSATERIASLLGRTLVRPRATPGGESIGANQGVYW